jgi:hypothetical protein
VCAAEPPLSPGFRNTGERWTLGRGILDGGPLNCCYVRMKLSATERRHQEMRRLSSRTAWVAFASVVIALVLGIIQLVQWRSNTQATAPAHVPSGQVLAVDDRNLRVTVTQQTADMAWLLSNPLAQHSGPPQRPNPAGVCDRWPKWLDKEHAAGNGHTLLIVDVTTLRRGAAVRVSDIAALVHKTSSVPIHGGLVSCTGAGDGPAAAYVDLDHSRHAKYCRPNDPEVCHDAKDVRFTSRQGEPVEFWVDVLAQGRRSYTWSLVLTLTVDGVLRRIPIRDLDGTSVFRTAGADAAKGAAVEYKDGTWKANPY